MMKTASRYSSNEIAAFSSVTLNDKLLERREAADLCVALLQFLISEPQIVLPHIMYRAIE